MNLKEQQYIVTLAGCGSMTQAAKKLNITQPALSSYLAGVENSLGYPLFERTGKALRPTYLGELYLEKARKILALGEEFQQQREQVLHGYQGRIRVGIPIRRSPHLIPSALKIFRSRFPNVEVDYSNELLADYARRRRAHVVVKGLRAVSDFEQEVQMAVINRKLNPRLETMFLASSEKYTYLSSTIVKEMARYGANLADFVPREIVDDVNRRMSEMKGKEG